jgi:hypothetical protein
MEIKSNLTENSNVIIDLNIINSNIENDSTEEIKKRQLEAEEEERKKQIRLSRFGKVDEEDYTNDILLGKTSKKSVKKEKDISHLLEEKPLFSKRSNISQDPVYVEDPEKIFTSKSKENFKLNFINDPPLLDKRKVIKFIFYLY